MCIHVHVQTVHCTCTCTMYYNGCLLEESSDQGLFLHGNVKENGIEWVLLLHELSFGQLEKSTQCRIFNNSISCIHVHVRTVCAEYVCTVHKSKCRVPKINLHCMNTGQSSNIASAQSIR